jgi:hypothetical protein
MTKYKQEKENLKCQNKKKKHDKDDESSPEVQECPLKLNDKDPEVPAENGAVVQRNENLEEMQQSPGSDAMERKIGPKMRRAIMFRLRNICNRKNM